jgi:hypothetical protein
MNQILLVLSVEKSLEGQALNVPLSCCGALCTALAFQDDNVSSALWNREHA